jgi:hypothetical protein
MKHQHVRTLSCGGTLLATMAMTLFACGGRETTASKSAGAYDEAKKKGIPIAAGEHGGHVADAAAEQPAATPANDAGHSAIAGMDHSTMTGMDHSNTRAAEPQMSGMDHSAMAGMDHSKVSAMQHSSSAAGTHHMAGMDYAAMPGMAHGSMTGMQRGGSTTAMPGMQHGSTISTVVEPPTTNAAIAKIQPAATLRPDDFDAAAPTAIDEAAKAASGMSHGKEKVP